MSLEALFARLATADTPDQRPVVMLSYAQSLDGSVALRRGESLALSSPPALAFTHRLRAAHDAILVGVGTVLADNPRLSVRLVSGSSPQPVVLDTHLRFPNGAALLEQPCLPWIATGPKVNAAKKMALQDKGVTVLALPLDATGRRSPFHKLRGPGRIAGAPGSAPGARGAAPDGRGWRDGAHELSGRAMGGFYGGDRQPATGRRSARPD